MDTKIIEKKFEDASIWQWKLRVGESEYGIHNISTLFPEWDADSEGNHMSFAHMVNTYGESVGVSEVGFETSEGLEWFPCTWEEGPFFICLRYRQDLSRGIVLKYAVIKRAETEMEIFIEAART